MQQIGDTLDGTAPRSAREQRYRHGGQFQEPTRNKLDRNDRARLLVLAEAFERRTKAKGRHGGALGRCGLAVLRTLLFRFCGHDGRCFPAIKTIAAACAMSQQAVMSALKRLEEAGIIWRERRIKRIRVTRISPWTGEIESYLGTVQASNSYLFDEPYQDAKGPEPTGRATFPPRRQGLLAGLFRSMKLVPSDSEESHIKSYPLGLHRLSTVKGW